MTENSTKIFCIFLLGLLLGLYIGTIFRTWVLEEASIKAGAARYNPKTAKFEWIHDKKGIDE